jgi:2-polyprenyl-6-methoxyphenol hydroxylase-like FAD-dependent oxidoreductase
MRVLISGAGIAGLSLALRLHQRGLVPIVLERSPRLRDGGYTLGLSDPGYYAAERMGVAEALRAAHHLPARLAYLDGAGRERFSIGSRTLERFIGRRQLSLMRGDIERVLYDRVRAFSEVRFGASVASLDAGRNGVRAVLEDGSAVECDLVAGADGLHSRVRGLRFGAEARFLRPLGARVAAFILDRAEHPLIEPGSSHSVTEIGRLAALADAGRGRLVAFFIHRAAGPRSATVEAELRSAFAGAGWLVPTLLDLLPGADAVYAETSPRSSCPGGGSIAPCCSATPRTRSRWSPARARPWRWPAAASSPTRLQTSRTMPAPPQPRATRRGSGPWSRRRSRRRGATFSSSLPRTAPNSCCARRRCASPRRHS